MVCFCTLPLRFTVTSDSSPTNTPTDIRPTDIKRATTWSIVLGVLMVVAGIIAISLPLATGIFAAIWIGLIFASVGVTKLIYAWQTREDGGFLPKLLVALVYLAAGIFLFVSPLEGVVTLTLVLATFLLVEGAIELYLAFQMRSTSSNWGWVLADGIVTLLFGLLIGLEWPTSAAWVIGLILGFSIISSGVSRIMLSLTARSALSAQ
jgi:uncharacterized membrane protein HdeD (DUF308 family)